MPCIDTPIPVDEIYERVELPPLTVREDDDEYTLGDYEREWVLAPASRS